MPKHERWKIILILVVLFASLWAVYPPSEKIKLGLDLKGGVHILLQARERQITLLAVILLSA